MDKKKKIFALCLIGALGITLGAVVFLSFWRSFTRARQAEALLEQRRAAWRELKYGLESRISSFRGQSGIVVKDLTHGWQYSLNKDTLFPSASMVKIAIMAAVFQAAQEGRISLHDQMTLAAAHKTSGSGTLKNAPAGTRLSVEELVRLMVTASDNTATNMLIDRLGFDYYNDFFKKTGLSSTNLSRKMMAFAERRKGVENYTTAQDMALILEKIYRRELVDRQVSERCLGFLLEQKVRDRIPKKLPEQTAVAHKTGLERFVYHDAGIVFTARGDFLICVLTRTDAGAAAAKDFIADLALVLFESYTSPEEARCSMARARGG